MSMSRNEMNEAIEKFLEEGGEVIHLKYANKKMQEKSARKAYHISRQSDNPGSAAYLAREEKKESQLLFSKEDRMRK